MDTYIVGNWKMNQDLSEIKSFFSELNSLPPQSGVHTWIAPQNMHIHYCLKTASVFFKIGAQNCSDQVSGAFTGENSPKSLKDIGAHFTLVGHSERRTLFGENDELLAKKTKTAIENGLKVIFCIGESLDQRESEQTLEVVNRQIQFLDEFGYSEDLLIAYEPVWAIGTGLSATPEQAEEVHAFIRKTLIGFWGEEKANQVPLLYGGSVKPENVEELLAQSNINGALVGGASLVASKFKQLYTHKKQA